VSNREGALWMFGCYGLGGEEMATGLTKDTERIGRIAGRIHGITG